MRLIIQVDVMPLTDRADRDDVASRLLAHIEGTTLDVHVRTGPNAARVVQYEVGEASLVSALVLDADESVFDQVVREKFGGVHPNDL